MCPLFSTAPMKYRYLWWNLRTYGCHCDGAIPILSVGFSAKVSQPLANRLIRNLLWWLMSDTKLGRCIQQLADRINYAIIVKGSGKGERESLGIKWRVENIGNKIIESNNIFLELMMPWTININHIIFSNQILSVTSKFQIFIEWDSLTGILLPRTVSECTLMAFVWLVLYERSLFLWHGILKRYLQ